MSTPLTMTSGECIERTISVQGIQTHLFEGGSSSAPPLVFLHEPHAGNLWLDYHRALAQQFHVFAPDLPGFGLTEKPDWMRDISDYVLYLHDLLQELDLTKPFLVGHSLGGWIGAELSVWYPEMPGKLVLCNTLGIRVKGTPIADRFALNAQELFALIFEHLEDAAPLNPAEITNDVLLRQYRENTSLASLMWNRNYDPKLERRLTRITCPTMILWGANDRLIPPVYAETWHRLIAGSQLVLLPNTGHMPMFEQPEAWMQQVAAFLQAEKE